MNGKKIKTTAEQKARDLGTSLYGASPQRPRPDAPDSHKVNKLAATVG
jgi:hypothetical protein